MVRLFCGLLPAAVLEAGCQGLSRSTGGHCFPFLISLLFQVLVVSVFQFSGIQTWPAVSSCNRSPSVQSAEESSGEFIKKAECRYDSQTFLFIKLGWPDSGELQKTNQEMLTQRARLYSFTRYTMQRNDGFFIDLRLIGTVSHCIRYLKFQPYLLHLFEGRFVPSICCSLGGLEVTLVASWKHQKHLAAEEQVRGGCMFCDFKY